MKSIITITLVAAISSVALYASFNVAHENNAIANTTKSHSWGQVGYVVK